MNENELRRRFPHTSEAFIKANLSPRDHDQGAPSVAEPEPPLSREPLHEVLRKEGYASKVLIRVTCYRHHSLDEDDRCEKYFVDCCRYAGLIHGDAACEATIPRSKEVIIPKTEEEWTEIEITYFPL